MITRAMTLFIVIPQQLSNQLGVEA